MTGKQIKIKTLQLLGLSFCGVRAYGTQTGGDNAKSPGIGSTITVDNMGVPYVVNVKGEVYKLEKSITGIDEWVL